MTIRQVQVLLVSGAFLLLTATPATAVPVPETEAPPGRSGAEPGDQAAPWADRRFAHCGAYDPEGDRWVVFGGRAADGATHYDDTWALDLGEGRPRWAPVVTGGAAPPAVRGCAAAYDPDGRRMLVFGGWDGTDSSNEVWALSLAGEPAWSQVCSAVSCGTAPTPRRGAQASYDAEAGRLLVFGGSDGLYRNDLWALTLDGAPAWRIVSTPGGAPPSRAGHAQALDADGGRVWVFGGSAAGAERNDLWRFDLATGAWTQVAPDGCPSPCPDPAGGASLVHDPVNDQLVLFGGYDYAAGTYGGAHVLRDVDGQPVWSALEPASAALQTRSHHTAAYDPRQQRMLVFGGAFGGSTFKDVAALYLPEGAPPYWRGVAPTTDLTARDQAAVHWDAGDYRLYAFGGFGTGALPGSNEAGTHLADTFRLDAVGRGGGWEAVTPTDGEQVPLQREATAHASDPGRDRLFVVGGLHGDAALNDVWVADFAEGEPVWEQLCTPTSCGAAPPARWGGHAVYEPDDDRLVLFGGRGDDGTAYNDVWTLSLSGRPRWERLAPEGAVPAARWGAAAVYDAQRDRMVVWGGQDGIDGAVPPFFDTWSLTLDRDPDWQRLDPAGTAPTGRRSMAYALRTAAGDPEMVVVGGYTSGAGVHYNDVYRLRLDTEQGTWEPLTLGDCSSATAPLCGRSASAVYDAEQDRLLLVFGRDQDGFFDDAHAFDFGNRTWTRLSGTGRRPGARRQPPAGTADEVRTPSRPGPPQGAGRPEVPGQPAPLSGAGASDGPGAREGWGQPATPARPGGRPWRLPLSP